MVDFAPLALSAHDLLLLRAGQVQAFAKDRSIEGEILTFTPEFAGTLSYMPSLAEQFQKLFDAGPRVSLSKKSMDSVQAWYRDFSRELTLRGKPYSDERIEYSFALLVSRLIALDEFVAVSNEIRPRSSRLVRDFSALLKSNFLVHRNPGWYSKKLGVSTRTLDRQILGSLKKTCKQLITENLILEAKRLLTDPDLQIKDIAYSLNFDEAANFSRFFRQNAGVTPRDFKSRVFDWPLEPSKPK